jgi:hypothetical protein
MSNPSDDRKNVARRNAQDHFTATAQRDALAKEEQGKLRAKTAAKIAKLRALRLAKEDAEKEAAGAAGPAPAGAKAKRRPGPAR